MPTLIFLCGIIALCLGISEGNCWQTCQICITREKLLINNDLTPNKEDDNAIGKRNREFLGKRSSNKMLLALTGAENDELPNYRNTLLETTYIPINLVNGQLPRKIFYGKIPEKFQISTAATDESAKLAERN